MKMRIIIETIFEYHDPFYMYVVYTYTLDLFCIMASLRIAQQNNAYFRAALVAALMPCTNFISAFTGTLLILGCPFENRMLMLFNILQN